MLKIYPSAHQVTPSYSTHFPQPQQLVSFHLHPTTPCIISSMINACDAETCDMTGQEYEQSGNQYRTSLSLGGNQETTERKKSHPGTHTDKTTS